MKRHLAELNKLLGKAIFGTKARQRSSEATAGHAEAVEESRHNSRRASRRHQRETHAARGLRRTLWAKNSLCDRVPTVPTQDGPRTRSRSPSTSIRRAGLAVESGLSPSHRSSGRAMWADAAGASCSRHRPQRGLPRTIRDYLDHRYAYARSRTSRRSTGSRTSSSPATKASAQRLVEYAAVSARRALIIEEGARR